MNEENYTQSPTEEARNRAAEKKETSVVKCPNCGADLHYDPEGLCLKCSHCDTTVAISGTRSGEVFFDALPEEDPFDIQAGGSAYRCQNCGADTVYQGYDIAPSCPFCGASNIVKQEYIPGLRPTGILPFSRSKEDIIPYYKQWIKKKAFSPNKLRKNFKADQVQGVYLPVFTFDSLAHTNYRGRLGKRRTRTVHRNGKTYTETYTEWFHVSGSLSRKVDDLLVEACDSLDQKEMDEISPFDTNNAVQFDSSYFVGFKATRYNRSLNESWSIAKDIVDGWLYSEVKRMYNADVVDYIHLDTHHFETSYKYLLVPVWMCSYTYRKKRYGFIINGRSGKVSGKAPKSPWKVGGLVFGILAFIAFVVVMVYFFGG